MGLKHIVYSHIARNLHASGYIRSTLAKIG